MTGVTGFVGRNIFPLLKGKYDLFAPNRKEIDLRDGENIKRYVEDNKIDIILHCANPNPVKNAENDLADKMFEDSMRIFMNFYRIRGLCEKIIYLGSGAEFDKRYDMHMIREEEISRSLPQDVYGCTKYIMNELASKTENMYNLRLFACYGPTDADDKFITHLIHCCMQEIPLSIRQNCIFDYIHVYDLGKIIDYSLEHNLRYHDYNIASGRRITLEEIAQIVKEKMHSPQPIIIKTAGWNKEYTPDISRLQEFGLDKDFIPLEKGIEMQIISEQKRKI